MHGLNVTGQPAHRILGLRAAEQDVCLMEEFCNNTVFVRTAPYAVLDGENLSLQWTCGYLLSHWTSNGKRYVAVKNEQHHGKSDNSNGERATAWWRRQVIDSASFVDRRLLISTLVFGGTFNDIFAGLLFS
jgi:hypothetical protein